MYISDPMKQLYEKINKVYYRFTYFRKLQIFSVDRKKKNTARTSGKVSWTFHTKGDCGSMLNF